MFSGLPVIDCVFGFPSVLLPCWTDFLDCEPGDTGADASKVIVGSDAVTGTVQCFDPLGPPHPAATGNVLHFNQETLASN